MRYPEAYDLLINTQQIRKNNTSSSIDHNYSGAAVSNFALVMWFICFACKSSYES